MNAFREGLSPHFGTYRSIDLGEGLCPTGLQVQFTETFTLEGVDDWIRYEQRAVEHTTGRVLHHEAGVMREGPSAGIEASLVMNSGRMEWGQVSWTEQTLEVESHTFFIDRRNVRGARRTFAFSGDRCAKKLWLANPVWPTLTLHMWCVLERVA